VKSLLFLKVSTLSFCFAASICHAQALSNACYKHIYDATSAENIGTLRDAINAFESQGCPTSRPGVSASTMPSIEVVSFLLYKQSKKRITALEQSTVLAAARKIESGGSVQDYVVTKIEKGGGGIVLKEASKLDNTIRLNVDPKQLKEGQRIRIERETVERNK
jgi:hypothetical protein